MLLSFTTGLYAQKWLKDIGKVLNIAEKVVDKLPESKDKQSDQRNSTSAPVTFTYGDVKVSTTLPNFTIVVEDVKRIDLTKGAIYLTLINASNYPIRIYDWQNITELVDSKGNSYADYGKWELQIGDCTIKRYGTDGDYMFQSNQKVNAVFYITELNGTATTKSDNTGSFVKTTVRAPAVSIDNLTLNPSIVYQEENVRRNYTIEISNLKIPAYVHIDRTRAGKDTPIQVKGNTVRDTIRIEENIPVRNKEPEPEKDTNPILSTYSTSSEEPLVNGPENMVAVDPEGKDSPDKKDEPEINLPKKLDNITKELLTNTVKVVLAKRATYTIIRRGIFFTDERMQGNPLNHSYSFYKAMHDLGAFRIQEIDASKLASNSNIMSKATKHSSYPIAGTKCITITHIDKNLIRGMRKGIYGAGVALSETNVKENETGLAYDMNNIATYEFPNQFYELVNISDSEGYKFENGNILLTLVCDVIENPSDFSVALMKAYNKAYTPITGLTYDIPQAQKIIIAIDLHFDAGQKKWSYKGTYKKNMTTNKFELLYQ